MVKAKNALLKPVLVKKKTEDNTGTATPNTLQDRTSMENPYDPFRREKLLSEADDGTLGSLIQNI